MRVEQTRHEVQPRSVDVLEPTGHDVERRRDPVDPAVDDIHVLVGADDTDLDVYDRDVPDDIATVARCLGLGLSDKPQARRQTEPAHCLQSPHA